MNDYKKINKNWKAQENALGYYQRRILDLKNSCV